MPASMKHIVSVPWTDEERTALRQMWENGIGCTGIGRHLGRSKYSVRSEIETLNLGPRLVAASWRPRHSRHRGGAGTAPATTYNRCDPRRPHAAACCRVNADGRELLPRVRPKGGAPRVCQDEPGGAEPIATNTSAVASHHRTIMANEQLEQFFKAGETATVTDAPAPAPQGAAPGAVGAEAQGKGRAGRQGRHRCKPEA